MTMLSPAQEADNKLGCPTVPAAPVTPAAPTYNQGGITPDSAAYAGSLGSDISLGSGGVGVTDTNSLAAISAAGASVDTANQLSVGVTGISKMVDAWATSIGFGALSGGINQQVQQ